jgi:hypothetical protein
VAVGDLVPFRQREEQPVTTVSDKPLPTCWTCKNATFGERGTYCTVFSESILHEVMAAEDCEVYDSIDEVRKP